MAGAAPAQPQSPPPTLESIPITTTATSAVEIPMNETDGKGTPQPMSPGTVTTTIATDGKAGASAAAAPKANRPRLMYFPIRGRAEPIRLALVDAKVDYIEDSISFRGQIAHFPRARVAYGLSVFPSIQNGRSGKPRALRAVFYRLVNCRVIRMAH